MSKVEYIQMPFGGAYCIFESAYERENTWITIVAPAGCDKYTEIEDTALFDTDKVSSSEEVQQIYRECEATGNFKPWIKKRAEEIANYAIEHKEFCLRVNSIEMAFELCPKAICLVKPTKKRVMHNAHEWNASLVSWLKFSDGGNEVYEYDRPEQFKAFVHYCFLLYLFAGQLQFKLKGYNELSFDMKVTVMVSCVILQKYRKVRVHNGLLQLVEFGQPFTDESVGYPVDLTRGWYVAGERNTDNMTAFLDIGVLGCEKQHGLAGKCPVCTPERKRVKHFLNILTM